MKTAVTLTLLMSVFGNGLIAQDAVPPVPTQQPAMSRADAQRETMITELKLTPEQITRLDAINTEHAAKAKELNKAGLAAEDKQKQAREMQAKRESAMKAMMTTEQNEKWAALRKNLRDQRAQKHEELKKPHQE